MGAPAEFVAKTTRFIYCIGIGDTDTQSPEDA
jgi:hypothetical protein